MIPFSGKRSKRELDGGTRPWVPPLIYLRYHIVLGNIIRYYIAIENMIRYYIAIENIIRYYIALENMIRYYIAPLISKILYCT